MGKLAAADTPHGDNAGTAPSPARAARRAESTAGVPQVDGSPTRAGASESAAQVAAGRCEAVRHSCCNDPEARFRRATSGHAPDNPDSNTAPSNRADIAFVCLAKPAARAAEGKAIAARAPHTTKAPKLARLCSCGSSESRRIYTISSGAVAKLWKTHKADLADCLLLATLASLPAFLNLFLI
jgi:hypothetical protein